MTQIETLVAQLGFPIAVMIWLLYERSKTLTKLTEAINNNTRVIDKLCTKLKKDPEIP